MQRIERRSFLSDQQKSGRFPVESVCEFEKSCLRPLATQLFDDPETHSTAAVNRRTGRFVERNQCIIFENDRESLAHRYRWRLENTRREPDWRNAELVPERQPIGWIDALAVGPDLATMQDTINMAFRDALAHPQQEIVDALASLLLANDFTHDRRGFA